MLGVRRELFPGVPGDAFVLANHVKVDGGAANAGDVDLASLATAEGSASEVKLVTVGCHVPSGLVQAGCGQWQKPLEYLPFRSSRSRFIEADS